MENKLYHLHPNSYGMEYFVLANSKEQALEFIIQSGEYEVKMFKNSTINNLPWRYTLEEYKLGEVISSEIC